jgi:BolA protein
MGKSFAMTSRIKTINDILHGSLKISYIKIEDFSSQHASHMPSDAEKETHLKLILRKDDFQNLSRLEIHRKINNLLFAEFDKGLHALTIELI